MNKISIIIPSLNEENYLPILLSNIFTQNLFIHEVIIVDGFSSDKTLEKIKRFNVKIIQTRPSVSFQRNEGAKISTGDILIFIDSDAKLRANILNEIMTEFERKKLSIASTLYNPYDGDLIIKLIYNILNLGFYFSQRLNPTGGGSFIIIKRGLFNKLNGFNQDLELTEDIDFFRRAAKIAKFAIISLKVDISARRFNKYGKFKTTWFYLKLSFFLIFNKLELINKLKYKFGEYDKSNNI